MAAKSKRGNRRASSIASGDDTESTGTPWSLLAPELWKTILLALPAASVLRCRLCGTKLATAGKDDGLWASLLTRLDGRGSKIDLSMTAYGRAVRLLCIQRRGNRDLDQVWSPATALASRASDARKVTSKISDRLAELAVLDAESISQYLVEIFPLDPFFRIAVLNLVRAVEHPTRPVNCAYPRPAGSAREIVLMMGLPAAGKTSYVKEHLGSHAVVTLGARNQGTAELIDAINHTTSSIVVDGCHSNPQRHRAPVILAAHQYLLPVRIIHIATKFSVCKQRNNARPKEERVSHFAFGGYQQYFVPPSILEGVFEVLVK